MKTLVAIVVTFHDLFSHLSTEPEFNFLGGVDICKFLEKNNNNETQIADYGKTNRHLASKNNFEWY